MFIPTWACIRGSARAHGDGNEATDPVTARVRAEDSFKVEDPALSRARAEGLQPSKCFRVCQSHRWRNGDVEIEAFQNIGRVKI